MMRRTALAFCVLTLLLPLAGVASPQSVNGKPGPASGIAATVSHPTPRGVTPQLPAAAAHSEAPKPETDISAAERARLKQEAHNLRHTGGREIHFDLTPSPLAPGVGIDFNGMGQNGWIPYDAAIAVGPNHVLEMTNSQWAVYNRSGMQLSINQFASWWGTPAGTPFDPRCFYDAASNRYVMVAVSVNNTLAFYHISVSQTGDPTGAWFSYQMDAELDGTTQTNLWADFPTLGYDDNAVYLGSNQFSQAGFFQYYKLRVLSKVQLYSGAALTYTDFVDMRNADNTKAFTLQPARSLTPTTTMYLLNNRSGSGSNVTLWSVTGAPGAPVLTRQATITVGAYSLPPDAPQPNTSTLVATNDARVHETVWRNGVLHAVFNESVSGRAAMRYLRINTAGNTLLKDASFTGSTTHYYFPAVAVDSADNVYFVFSRSSSTEFASLYQTGMTPADINIQASALVKAGVGTNTTGRWGDYSAVSIDPADSLAVWIYGGWANTSNRWATWVAQPMVSSGPQAPTLSSVTPNSGTLGQNVAVTLNGTNFLSSFTINVSGSGVNVNNPQFVSSTELMATFAIAGGAGTGAHNVTVTTANGTSNAQTFTVNSAAGPPTLATRSPSTVNPNQSVLMTLTGTNFVNGNTTLAFTTGTGITPSNINVQSPTQMTVTFNMVNASIGGHKFNVTTPAGTSNTLNVDVLNAPVLNSVTPNNANPGQAVNVTLSGQYFYNGSTVNVANPEISVSNTVKVNGTTLTATFTVVSGATPGGFNVTVANLAGTSNARAFTINGTAPSSPAISNINPASGFIGRKTTVTINGSNFLPSPTINLSGTGVVVGAPSTLTDTQIVVEFDVAGTAALGARNVTVSNTNGTSNAVTFDVQLPPAPTLATRSPSTVNPNQSVLMTLTGANFVNGATTLAFVTGTGVSPSNLMVLSPTQLTVTFDVAANASIGGHQFRVTTPAGTSNTLHVDVLNVPVLNSVTPNSASPGAVVNVTLSGQYFYNGSTVTVSGAGVGVSNVVKVNGTTLTATFTVAGGALPGPRDVRVTNLAGTSNAVQFTVQ